MGHHGLFRRTIIHNLPQNAGQVAKHVNFDRAPMPMDSEIYISAVALVDVALNMNTDARRVWVDIICAWGKPADMLMSEVNGEFGGYLQGILSGTTIEDKKLLSSGYKKWEAKFGWNPDSITLKNAVNNFILTAYNGPTEPKSYQRMGLDIYQIAQQTINRWTTHNSHSHNTHNNNVITHLEGDCLELLKTIPDKSGES